MGIGKIRSGLIDLKNSHQLAMYPFSELIATLYNIIIAVLGANT